MPFLYKKNFSSIDEGCTSENESRIYRNRNQLIKFYSFDSKNWKKKQSFLALQLFKRHQFYSPVTLSFKKIEMFLTDSIP